jgi:MinD-like ATPase involved in chromosome partitioning or flagellar assembly
VVTFDDALPTLVRLCEAAPGFTTLKTACVVRDLRGRLRLLLDPDPSAPPGAPSVDVDVLQQQLSQELGGYFAPPLWSTRGAKPDETRLARVLIEQATDWPDAGYDDPVSGSPTRAQAHWKKLERRLSKQAWLESAGREPPWQLAATTPSIVTFYSFKGGVGRTTALVACAWQLARTGKKVMAIDLDLEAPGLGALFEVKTNRGVVDLLVDHLAAGTCDLDGAVAERSPALGADGDRVSIIPAGRLEASYLEKLARLDFVSANPPAGTDADPSPIEQALQAILRAVFKQLKPDYILLDSRAGLHDLAGLSLHSLAHVDVLVGRATEQGYLGFDLTLGVLAKRKGADKLQCVVVHTFAPSPGTPEAVIEEDELLHRSFMSFAQHIYGPEKAKTMAETDEGPHTPVVIRRHAELERFASLGSIESTFFAPDFGALKDEIEALCTSTGAVR